MVSPSLNVSYAQEILQSLLRDINTSFISELIPINSDYYAHIKGSNLSFHRSLFICLLLIDSYDEKDKQLFLKFLNKMAEEKKIKLVLLYNERGLYSVEIESEFGTLYYSEK